MKKPSFKLFALLLALITTLPVVFWETPAAWAVRTGEYLGRNMAEYHSRRGFEQLKPALLQEIEHSPFAIRLCLYDFATGEWIGVEENRPVYPASLIKTLYLLAALEEIEKGNLSLQQVYPLTEPEKYAGGTPVTGTGILQFAPTGSSYSLEELLSLMIGLSDNIAANMVLDLARPAQVAHLARRLGLKQTRATRKMYDLTSPLPSNRSTAKELTKMLIALQNRQICNEQLTRKAIKMMEQTDNKERIGLELGRNGVTVANKVGTVSEMIGDMALIYFPHRPPVALTVMVENPPSERQAAQEIGRLSAIVVNFLKY